jgi:hypothetical protein
MDATPGASGRRPRVSWGDAAGATLEHVQEIERRKPRPGFLAQSFAVLKEELYWGFKRPSSASPDGESCAEDVEALQALNEARANALANVRRMRELSAQMLAAPQPDME